MKASNRKNVSSGSPFEPEIGFSRAVRIGDVIAVSGTAPLDPSGKTAHAGDLYGQTKRCLEIALEAAREAGGGKENVLRTRVYLTDISRWRDAARAHGEVFSGVRPACTFLQVDRFIDAEWLVELEMDCVLGEESGAQR